jgi:hypothetical protein
MAHQPRFGVGMTRFANPVLEIELKGAEPCALPGLQNSSPPSNANTALRKQDLIS